MLNSFNLKIVKPLQVLVGWAPEGLMTRLSRYVTSALFSSVLDPT